MRSTTNRMGLTSLFYAVVKTEVSSSSYQNLLDRLVLWSLNHGCADLNSSSTDYPPARTVLLERKQQWKPIICWSDELQGDLTGNSANIVYKLIWCFPVHLWHILAALLSSIHLFMSLPPEERSLHSDIHGAGEMFQWDRGRVSCGQAFGTVLTLARHFLSGRQEITLY